MLRRWFSTDEQCRDFLMDLRHPSGWACSCGATAYWWRSPTTYRCLGCLHERSVLAGTIFHRTRTALPIWFEAAWDIATAKNGISAIELQRDLGIGSYETAWAMLHRYRRAMVFANRTPLTGHVEVDETFVGGHKPGKRGRGAAGKTIVLIAVETPAARGFGRVRLEAVADCRRATLHQFIKDNIEVGSTVATDGLAAYVGIERAGYTHEADVISQGSSPAHVAMPGVHRVAALLKRWLLGTHQGRVEAAKLQPYLDEFAFRFNRRRGASVGLVFHRLIEGAVAHAPVTARDVILNV